ncbi:HAD family phosphatase [Patescibacteria group bacterium]|nr:HAD family phosphatase [Patescibacteria group bacterium]MBU1673791.1 HAD family phosphatase [Patescibacteria group bacterium]MBU1963818.1 HAD family phosphatase [Patescibacteria group bacterium]
MKNQPKIKAVIFDMDGVLADNIPFHFLAWQKTLKDEYGIHLTKKFFFKYLNARRGYELIRVVIGKVVSPKKGRSIIQKKDEHYRKIYTNKKPVDGLVGFLKYLKKKKIKIALATSAHKGNADFILDGFKIKKYFDVVVTAEKIKKSKPDPEIFLLAANKLKTKPANCLVVEDAPLGVRSGKKAGMRVAGMLTQHTKKDLAQADLYISNYNQKKLYTFIDAGASYRPGPYK